MKDVQAIYFNCRKMIEDLGIKPGIVKSVKVNTRAKRRWGCCKITKTGSTPTYTIEISYRLLLDEVDDKVTEDTMLHEILHTCKFCFNHGAEWKRLANKVNKAYGYDIKRCTSSEEKGIKEVKAEAKPKHKVVCTKCGAEVYRKKDSKLIKYPHMFCCAKCGGDFRKEY